MKRELNTTGILVFLLFLGLALVAYCNFALGPLLAANEAMNQQHESDVRQAGTFQSNLINQQQLKKQLQEMDQKIAKEKSGNNKAPSAFDVSDFLAKGLAETGVSAENMSIENGSAVSGAKKSSQGLSLMRMPAALTVNCTEPQLESLLAYLESGKDLACYLDKVEFNPGESASGPANISLSVFYYSKEQPASSSSEAAVEAAVTP